MRHNIHFAAYFQNENIMKKQQNWLDFSKDIYLPVLWNTQLFWELFFEKYKIEKIL